MKFWQNRIYILLFLSFLMTKAVAIPFGSLNMPVQFIIENGDFTNSTVNVKKNGELVLSMLGEKNMRLKLEYGNEYLLSFSKPGYITKKIEVKTNVAVEHGKQGFEPYKIGVRLFKQYEGVNIVVYNQPVAIVNYQARIDAFGYDVDYTKSILSELTTTENILEAKAAEERAQQKEASDKLNASLKEENSKRKNNPNTVIFNSPIAEINFPVENHSVQSGTPQSDKPNEHPFNAGENIKPKSKQLVGEDPQKLATNIDGVEQLFSNPPTGGEEMPNEKIAIQHDQDTVHFSESKNINDLPIVHFKREKSASLIETDSSIAPSEKKREANSKSDKGIEFHKVINTKKAGNESASTPLPPYTTFNRTIEKKVESNRIITTIRITNGDHTTEYRHIVYNWGGEYFFVNNSEPLSPHLFDLYTGQ